MEGLIVQLFNVAVAHFADVFDLALDKLECLICFCLCAFGVGLIEVRTAFEAGDCGFGEVVELLYARLYVRVSAMFH